MGLQYFKIWLYSGPALCTVQLAVRVGICTRSLLPVGHSTKFGKKSTDFRQDLFFFFWGGGGGSELNLSSPHHSEKSMDFFFTFTETARAWVTQCLRPWPADCLVLASISKQMLSYKFKIILTNLESS